MKKLTPTLKERWGLFVIDKIPDIPTVADFDKWLDRLAKAPRFAMDNSSAETPQRAFERKKEFRAKAAYNVYAIARQETSSNSAPAVNQENTSTRPLSNNYNCFVCGTSPPHRISECTQFPSLTPEQRYEKVKQKGRCFRCVVKHSPRFNGCRKRNTTSNNM